MKPGEEEKELVDEWMVHVNRVKAAGGSSLRLPNPFERGQPRGWTQSEAYSRSPRIQMVEEGKDIVLSW